MENLCDKLSIKNLLFTKTIPNHEIPIPINGHTIYPCTDCGDKFIFETSYHDHITRKSAKISYMCRHCNQLKIFNNRCNLLFHIRSHAFKTATINVTDLKVEPLPLSFYKIKCPQPKPSTSTSKPTPKPIASSETSPARASLTSIFCFECKKNITTTGTAYKDRTSHFMQYTNEVYACPVCLFALPSICALKVHLRLHLKCPPYYCPECGIHLVNKNVQYPYNHDCEGFKMMRATARLNCAVPDCGPIHPNDYKEHMKKFHIRKVYKCPLCVVACFNESTMEKHLKGHNSESTALIFYQCDICPGKYVMQNLKLNDHHLRTHINTTVYPCWACGTTFKEVSTLLNHFMTKHNQSNIMESAVNDVMNETGTTTGKCKRIYRVVKRCDQCKRSFTYKCKYDDIQVLPNECPFKCNSNMKCNVTTEKIQKNAKDHITCHLCHLSVTQDWEEIKKHYAEYHKTHKCLDAEILVTRIDIAKYLPAKGHKTKSSIQKKAINKISKKIRHSSVSKAALDAAASRSPQHIDYINLEKEKYVCSICGSHYEHKVMLESHILTHRDPCMAYQCMECGRSFSAKPSFSKHLLLEHGLADAADYMNL